MIDKVVHWLSRHRFINFLLVALYALFLVFAHDPFVKLSVIIMDSLSLAVYEKVVAIISLLGVIGFVVFIVVNVRKGRTSKRALFYFFVTLSMLITHFFVLTEMNIEMIHAFMYGILACLIYPLVERNGGAVLLGLPIMLIDELYQYLVLFPHYTFIYELNDIVLDLFGAGLFVSTITIAGVKSRKAFVPLFKRIETWMLGGLILVMLALLSTCLIVCYEEDACNNTWLILNHLHEPYSFWRFHPIVGTTYHLMRPIEGMIVVGLVCMFYLGMDSTKTDK